MRFVRPLLSATTYRRWTFVLGGTALLVPYVMIYAGVLQILRNVNAGEAAQLVSSVLLLAVFIPVSTAVAFVPGVRMLCRTSVETLLGVDLPAESAEGMRSWRSRRRTALWFVAHIGFGGAVGLFGVAAVSIAVVLLQTPFLNRRTVTTFLPDWTPPWPVAVVGGLLIVPLVVALGSGAGALLSRLAPVLLGPSTADRMAQLEHRTEQLMERNRLARELHDSVGHALTVTTLQAGAAIRVLDSDPEFARRALSAIEETGRTALEDLDHVLGLLREDAGAKTPQRTLADLDALFDSYRATGVDVLAEVGGLDDVPPVVSREAYRIVQEGLTNALRHAGKVPVTVRLAVRGDRLELEVANPIDGVPPTRTDGGRGLRGVRERVAILGGRLEAGAGEGEWRISAGLPVRWAS